VSPRTIQELLEHRSVTITEDYIASSGRHRDAVVRLDMGSFRPASLGEGGDRDR